MAFGDAVKLETLARGDAQRVVAVFAAEFVEGQIDFGEDGAAGQASAHHVNVLFGDLAFVAVIALVNAVEFEELVIVVGKAFESGIGQGLADVATEVGQASFNPSLRVSFDGAEGLIIINLVMLVTF